MRVQKKVGGANLIIKIKILFVFFVLFFSKISLANIVLDHEIEKFLKEIIKPIITLSHSNFEESDLVIILEKTPNAFVNRDKKIVLTTGLLTFADRSEEILGILAHEIRHLDANHIDMRIEKLDNHKSISELSKIISLSTSLITNNPDFFIGINIAVVAPPLMTTLINDRPIKKPVGRGALFAAPISIECRLLRF